MGDPPPSTRLAQQTYWTSSTQEAPPGSERAKIERLIELVRASKLTFVRNGKAYDANDAAEHLASKLEHTPEPGMTARDFIDRVASYSSQSGEPYLLQRADGKTTPVHDWLVARLAEIEAAH